MGIAFSDVSLDLITDEERFPKEAKKHHLKKAKKILRDDEMQDWKYQLAMDTSAGGSLNYSTLDTLRKVVEGLGHGETGLYPSGSAVKNCAYTLENCGAELGLDFEEVQKEMGFMYKFNHDKLLRYTIDRHGLTKYAVEGAPEEGVLWQ